MKKALALLLCLSLALCLFGCGQSEAPAHLKTLQHFYVKIQQLYLRKSVLIGFQIEIGRAHV